MRMKPVTRLLVLALVLMMFPALALADSCILCGEESGNDAYVCAYCMLDMLAEKDTSAGMEITNVITNENGSVTLTWSDSAENGPYSVYYELLETAPVPFGWMAAEGLQQSAVTLTQLVPGVCYVFTVKDAAGNQVKTIYNAPALENGNEIGAKFRLETRYRSGRNYSVAPFSASKIEQDNGQEPCLAIKLSYSMLIKTRYYAFALTVEAPNGFEDVICSGTLTLNRGRSEVAAWGFIMLDDYFDCLQNYYGGIPTGEYRVNLYFDGKYIYTVPFDVTE